MATHKLNIEDEEELELLGIQSSWPEHRLVWTLNRSLGIVLKRMDDYVVDTPVTSKGLFESVGKWEFSVFRYETDMETITLVANLGQGMALYDKGRPFDYLLRVESIQRELADCADCIAEQQGILAVGKINCDNADRAAKPFNELE